MCFMLRSRALLFALFMMAMSLTSYAQFAVSVSFGPPALPIYSQPLCPGEGYLWTPGYWAYDDDYGDYYWVPGTWVLAPEVGYLWTPPYWGWGGNAFLFHEGYWGPQVGFYGGIAYGYGYFGNGYQGGRWNNGQFYYNRSVNNVNVTNIHNVYNTTVVNNTTVNRVSYNGGQGGINAQPTAAEQAASRERHLPPVAAQAQHVQAAASNPQLRASINHGKPPIAATAKPASFSGAGVVPAKAAGAPYHPPANRAAQPAAGNHPAQPAAGARPAEPAAANHPVAQPPASNRPPTGSPERAAAPAPHPENTPAAHPENKVPQPPAPIHAKDLPPHQPPAAPNTGNAEADRNAQQQQQKLYAQQQAEHQKLAQQQQQDHQRAAQQQANAARTQQMEQQHQQQTQQMEQRHAQEQQQLARPPAPPPSHNQARPPEKH